MRILMTGDRFLTCRALAAKILRRLVARYGNDIDVVIGGNPGVDASVAHACRELGITTHAPKFDWYGGLDRTKQHEQMVAEGADLCILIHYELRTSERTKDVARRAVAAGIPTFLIETDRGAPIRIEEGNWRLR